MSIRAPFQAVQPLRPTCVLDAVPLIIVAKNIKKLIGTGINESVAHLVLKPVDGVNPGALNALNAPIVKRNVVIIDFIANPILSHIS